MKITRHTWATKSDKYAAKVACAITRDIQAALHDDIAASLERAQTAMEVAMVRDGGLGRRRSAARVADAVRALSRTSVALQRDLGYIRKCQDALSACSAWTILDRLREISKCGIPWHYDRHNRVLRLKTEHIYLDGTCDTHHMGAYVIEITTGTLGYDQWSFLIRGAGHHNRPASLGDHIHPHVSDSGYLCEGDGTHHLNMAMSRGSLLGVHTLVSTILGTYNAQSAFQPLEEKEDPDDDDYGLCALCGCDQVLFVCDECGEAVCGDCLHVAVEPELRGCDECATYSGHQDTYIWTREAVDIPSRGTVVSSAYAEAHASRCGNCSNHYLNIDASATHPGLCPGCRADAAAEGDSEAAAPAGTPTGR